MITAKFSAFVACAFSSSAVRPKPTTSVVTPLGTAWGTFAAEGVERYGGIPYALPPLGSRRFARAQINELPWPAKGLYAGLPGPPCIQTPFGDPRSQESESPPPSEDCLHLNVWRPSRPRRDNSPLPVMVFLFGGGLCGNFAGNEYYSGSNLAMKHDAIVVTISYRLGAFGYLVGDDPARPGSGGLNGLHDVIIALQWLQKYVTAFGGNARDVTLFGQSSGAYSTCTLSVAPAAKGLFRRASLISGPCFGGPPGRGWGPMSIAKGKHVTSQILKAHGAQTLDDLRKVSASQLMWPTEWMSNVSEAPYFSGYFEDPAVVPMPIEEMWQRGLINPEELIISFNSKDGTAAFYGSSPTLGLLPPYVNTNTAKDYEEAMRKVWGKKGNLVLQQYPLSKYPSAPAAFIQADADAYVICPSRSVARHAAEAGRHVWVSEFAHFEPSPSQPVGCSGYGPDGCKGFGCDSGVELGVVPGHRSDMTELWASHGAGIHFIFGTQRGPDPLGPPNNVTICTFNKDEQSLSDEMLAYGRRLLDTATLILQLCWVL